MMVIAEAVFVGLAVLMAGTLPRNLLFLANLRYAPAIPWAVPMTAVYLWYFWRYLGGWGPPSTNAGWRHTRLRAGRVQARIWLMALVAGSVSLAALVLVLRIANRMVVLPAQQLPDLSAIPAPSVFALLLMSSLHAGVVEEAAFRGYMQAPIERNNGPAIAILVTGVMFALAHLDFTPLLLPYYVAVAAIYGTITYMTRSILPSLVLHAAGNVYSNTDLWLRGRAEWQAARDEPLIWTSGPDASFLMLLVLALVLIAAAIASYRVLAAAVVTRADA